MSRRWKKSTLRFRDPLEFFKIAQHLVPIRRAARQILTPLKKDFGAIAVVHPRAEGADRQVLFPVIVWGAPALVLRNVWANLWPTPEHVLMLAKHVRIKKQFFNSFSVNEDLRIPALGVAKERQRAIVIEGEKLQIVSVHLEPYDVRKDRGRNGISSTPTFFREVVKGIQQNSTCFSFVNSQRPVVLQPFFIFPNCSEKKFRQLNAGDKLTVQPVLTITFFAERLEIHMPTGFIYVPETWIPFRTLASHV